MAILAVLRKTSDSVTFADFYAIRTLFVTFAHSLGDSSGLLVILSLLFWDTPGFRAKSDRLKVVILDGIERAQNRPIRRQELHPDSTRAQAGLLAASG